MITGALDELVDGIRNRDEAAFGTVYRLTASGLVSFAYGMLHDRLAAEDAVQQAFLELTRAAPTLRGDGRSLRSWLYRSVRFSCLDELRRRSRRPETPYDRVPDSAVTDDVDDIDPDLRAALMTLTDNQRELVVLRWVVGMTPEEIAGVVGSNRAAVYAALSRAQRSLQRSLTSVESLGTAASVSVETEPQRHAR